MQAGLTYNVNDNLKIDFSCRYLNLGSPQTAVVQCQNTAVLSGRLLHVAWTSPRRISASACAGCSRPAADLDLRRWGSRLSPRSRNMPRSRNTSRRSRNTLRFRRRNMSRRRPSNTCRCSRRCRAAADSFRANSFRDMPGRAARAKRMKERPMRWVFCFAMVVGDGVAGSRRRLRSSDPARHRGRTRLAVMTVGPATFTRWSGFYLGGEFSYSNANANFSNATRPLMAFSLATTRRSKTKRIHRYWRCSAEGAPIAAGYRRLCRLQYAVAGPDHRRRGDLHAHQLQHHRRRPPAVARSPSRQR